LQVRVQVPQLPHPCEANPRQPALEITMSALATLLGFPVES
jgi:hypothetical protein